MYNINYTFHCYACLFIHIYTCIIYNHVNILIIIIIPTFKKR